MKKTSPFKDRDLTSELLFPTVSWSSFNAFTDYDKDLWYDCYVLGIRKDPNKVMTIGIEVGERITQDPTFLPILERPEIFEHNLRGSIGKIKLRGHIDGSFPSIPGIDEYKTSLNKDRWSQKKVDEWKQITFYCTLYYMNFKIPPEKLRLRLWAIPIIEHGDFSYTAGEPKVFTTKRTMADVLKFCAEIQKTFKEMEQFIKTKQ